MHNPVAMPAHFGYELCAEPKEEFTLEEYFKGLQKFHPVEDEVKHVKSQQVGGSHYQNGALQPWDIFLAWKLDPWAANVVKYILRFPFKNGIEDLRKARHYIDFLISHYDEVKEKYYTKDKK
jgi:hypothetical protein